MHRICLITTDQFGDESTKRVWLDDLLLGEPDLTADIDALFGDAR